MSKEQPLSRTSKGVFEQGKPVPSPFDDAAEDFIIDAKDYYENRDKSRRVWYNSTSNNN